MPESQQSQRAGIYCRISVAKVDDRTKVADQERICRDLCERLGWEIAEVYTDNSRSAWQRNRKRPGWDQMLADVERGHITAIAVYHGDRLVRHPWDLEVLLDLGEHKGVKLASPTGTRDLGNPEDHFSLRIEAAVYKRESDATSRRRKNQYERWRREGRVRAGGRGGRAYGFATDGITLVPGEVVVVQEAARRILGGEPTGALARSLSAAGARTPTGAPFTHHFLRKMLARPRYAGLMPDGIHPAAWQAVLDRETWEAVCAVLDAKAAGFGYATNASRWLLSGIARCAVCGSGLQVCPEGYRAHDDGKQCVQLGCAKPHHWHRAERLTGYGCVQRGCRKVQRSARLLDEYVITRTLAKLNDTRNPPGHVPENHMLAREMRTLIAQRAATEEQIRDPARGGRLDTLLDRLDRIDARLAQLRELAAGSAGARLAGAHAGLDRERWDDLPLHTRRALVAALFTVTVLPASRRGPGFNSADVRLTPRR
jgi:DNA invertase Pin-like site-specific DNA recombinase